MSEGSSGRIAPIDVASLPAGGWSTTVPLRFGRCDAAGIVYTPHYFDLFIGVVEAWYLEALGIDYYDLLRRRRLGLGYGHASCEFFAPSVMGEAWQVAVIIERLGRSSLTILLHASVDGRERARGRMVSVATDLDTSKVVPLPTDVRAALERYQLLCA